MSDATMHSADATPRPKKSLMSEDARTKKRNAAERRFRNYGLAAICTGLAFLVTLVAAILTAGLPAFRQAVVEIPFTLTQEQYDEAEAAMQKTAI